MRNARGKATIFHVKRHLYVRTDLFVPGVGTLINIAHLEEIDDAQCTLRRMIEMNGEEAIMGAAVDGQTVGAINKPNETVPHPDTYDQFPDITATYLEADEFDALWTETVAKFPELC